MRNLLTLMMILTFSLFTSCEKDDDAGSTPEDTRVLFIIGSEDELTLVSQTDETIIVSIHIEITNVLESTYLVNTNISDIPISLNRVGATNVFSRTHTLLRENFPEATEYYIRFSSPDDYLESNIITIDFGDGSNEDIELGDALHTPTETGGTSIIAISGHTGNVIVNVTAKRTVDDYVLGNYSINVENTDTEFTVTVNYENEAIFNTGITLVAVVDGVSRTYTYTTDDEVNCVLSINGSYSGGSTVDVIISGNNRDATFSFKTYNNLGVFLNEYGGIMDASESTKTFNFPIEMLNNEVINFVVQSNQYPLCVLDSFSYTTPNRTTSLVFITTFDENSGGRTYRYQYTNTNLQANDEPKLFVNTSLGSDEYDIPGANGTIDIPIYGALPETSVTGTITGTYLNNPANISFTTGIISYTNVFGQYHTASIAMTSGGFEQDVAMMSLNASDNQTQVTEKRVFMRFIHTDSTSGVTSIVNSYDYTDDVIINGTSLPASNIANWTTSTDGFSYISISGLTEAIQETNPTIIDLDVTWKNYSLPSNVTVEIILEVVTNIPDNNGFIALTTDSLGIVPLN